MLYGVILASGLGTRFSDDLPKQFAKVAGKTVLEHTIEVFEKSNHIDRTIIVITPQYRHILEEILLKNHYSKVCKVLNGGDTRKESSSIAISSIDEEDAFVMIHDCARPFLSDDIIKNCVDALKNYDAVDVAIPSADTLIEVSEDKIIKNIPERKFMRRGQTPQCFKLSLIKKAHELSKGDENFTDDCGLVVKHNLAPVYVVDGESKNFKVTMPEDIFMADKIFQVNSMKAPISADFSQMKDKVLVVFGGHSGIGECVMNLALENGAKAYAFSLENGVDVSNYENVAQKLKEVNEIEGKIDYVINTAGILNIGKLLDRDILHIQKEIAVNYMGSINVSKASIPYLLKTKGCILLFASSSYTRGRALYSTYSSTKAGIVNLTQALSEELYHEGIRINVINPERTATPMRYKSFGKEPEGSLLAPEKVAEACLNTLLSTYTGQVIDVRRKG